MLNERTIMLLCLYRRFAQCQDCLEVGVNLRSLSPLPTTCSKVLYLSSSTFQLIKQRCSGELQGARLQGVYGKQAAGNAHSLTYHHTTASQWTPDLVSADFAAAQTSDMRRYSSSSNYLSCARDAYSRYMINLF